MSEEGTMVTPARNGSQPCHLFPSQSARNLEASPFRATSQIYTTHFWVYSAPSTATVLTNPIQITLLNKITETSPQYGLLEFPKQTDFLARSKKYIYMIFFKTLQ
jgi:hypothetical protein